MSIELEARRCFRVTIRISEPERLSLEQSAYRSGLTISAYARLVLTGAKPARAARRPPVEISLLARVLGQLGKIGSNLNQLAHAANTAAPRGGLTPFVERELARTLDQLQNCRRLLLQALGRKAEPA